MTVAKIVNLILQKLRTGVVTFTNIGITYSEWCVIEFTYAHHNYHVKWETSKVSVLEIRDDRTLIETSYSAWIQGVLNGGVRNDAGVVK